jgi:adenine-specific DNA methylase
MQKAFIETQFPIARLSAETLKERNAGSSQTLTGIGKWWGRKQLIHVRATILGMLMPASDNPKKDREIFLKILTMDDDGTWLRQKGDIPVSTWREAAPSDIKGKYFGTRGYQRGISDEQKEYIQAEIWEALDAQQRQRLDDQRKREIQSRTEFDKLPYALRLRYCDRPENTNGPSQDSWNEINNHLNTSSNSLPELIEQLGIKLFGHRPRVGDAFCGAGSIPFEAARIGCDSFGSDLSPVACMLTWSGLNLLGGSEADLNQISKLQQNICRKADERIKQWGIEHNSDGERTDAFLYCAEVKPPGCDHYIPLAPSWVIAEKYRVVVKWEKVLGSERLSPTVMTVGAEEFKQYQRKKGSTINDGRIVDPFDPSRTWSVEALRGPNGLRRWENDDIVPRPEDVFQERLYCIRWINNQGERRYAAPTEDDLAREAKVLDLISERFDSWQEQGHIPSRRIISGYNTDQPIRERGWTHWHHLFTPRQLLMHGLYQELASECKSESIPFLAACMIGIAGSADWSTKLCRWTPQLARSGGIGASVQTFYNQALNTLYTWANRPFAGFADVVNFSLKPTPVAGKASIYPSDARDVTETCDLWITDPPYADAVNYHELADFFLAWYDKRLAHTFVGWMPDSRAELAVRGDGDDFRRSMVEIYGNLAEHMPSNGLQVVMFTHKNPAVWADLGMILWAAGLRVTAAWTISTEKEAVGIKAGDYVQGTVCLVLRKRLQSKPGFLFDAFPLVEDEVRSQIIAMKSLDENSEPNFNDADYQLAAYAAALKILTQYSTLDGKNVADEVFAVRSKNEKSDFEQVIERAITIACDELIPKGLSDSWRDLNLSERYYLRSVDIESRGERRKGMYEELARGFGVTDIKPLLKSDKANGTRVHTPSGFGTSLLAPIDGAVASTAALPRRGRASASGPHPFAATPLRHLLFAICETAAADNDPNQGRQYLRDTFGQAYWGRREAMVRLLDWFAAIGNAEDTADWAKDSEAARILAGRLRNDDA